MKMQSPSRSCLDRSCRAREADTRVSKGRRLGRPRLAGPWLAGWVGLLALLAPRLAGAHALLLTPSPRDGSDAHKDPTGPCGVTRSAAQPVRQLTPGASFNVTWNETVTHPGCFVVDFSAADDANFQVLATLPHSAAGSTPRPYAQMVTLPAAPCAACTLRVRQIMLGAEPAPGAACPPAVLPTGSTYYTCANIVLGAGAVDAGSLPDAGGADAGGADAAGGRAADGGARGGSGGTIAAGSGGAFGPVGSGGAVGTAGTGGAIAIGTGGTTGVGATGGTTGSGTGSGGSASGGTTGPGASPVGADQSGGCACSAASAPRPPTIPALLAAAFIMVLLRRRGRSNARRTIPSPDRSQYPSANPSANASWRIR